MTALLASLGLLPAALSHAIGSDTQRPFAIVIIGGLISSTFLDHVALAHFIRAGRPLGAVVEALAEPAVNRRAV